jgi:hypothetical protein
MHLLLLLLMVAIRQNVEAVSLAGIGTPLITPPGWFGRGTNLG